jgi:hypothetical protein
VTIEMPRRDDTVILSGQRTLVRIVIVLLVALLVASVFRVRRASICRCRQKTGK